MPYFLYAQLSKNRAVLIEPDVRSAGENLQEVVGVTGFEPVTLRLSSACSNQLSYTPIELVELRRLELLTYSLQSYRSTN
jgi:hypothetical protein